MSSALWKIHWLIRERSLYLAFVLIFAFITVSIITTMRQSREIVYVLTAAALPALAPAIIVSTFRPGSHVIDLTLPVRIEVREVQLSALLGLIAGIGVGISFSRSQYPDYFAMDIMLSRTAMALGLAWILAAFIRPSFAWIAVFVVVVVSARTLLQDPSKIHELPTGILWWPISIPTTETKVAAGLIAVIGAWIYITRTRRPPRQFFRS